MLETMLMEVEPIFREVDDRFSFSHPSFQEVLTARQFADEINSGRLSVRNAYVHFWSYEDKELSDLLGSYGRIVFPKWKPILVNLFQILTEEKAGNMVEVILGSYLTNKSRSVAYIPYLDDLFVVAKLLGARPAPLPCQFERVVQELDRVASTQQLGSLEARHALTNLGMNPNYRGQIVSLIIERGGAYGHFVIDELVKLGFEDANQLLLDRVNTGNLSEGFDILSLRHSKSLRVRQELIEKMRVAEEPYFFASTLGDIGATEAVPDLMACLGKGKPHSANIVAFQAAKLGGEQMLIGYFRNPRNPRRCAVARALAITKSREALPLIMDYILDIQKPMKDPHYNVARKLNVARYLDYVDTPTHISQLISILMNRGSHASHIAAIVLGKSRCAQAVSYLLEYTENGRFPHFAVEALGNIGDERAIETLGEFAADAKKPYYWMAIQALGRIQSRLCMDPLLRIMRDKSNKCRYMAAIALSELGFPECLDYLAEYIDKPNLHRSAVALALAKHGGEPFIPTLHKYVSSSSSGYLVINAIGEIGGKQAVLYLKKLRDQYINNTFLLPRIDSAIAVASGKSKPNGYVF